MPGRARVLGALVFGSLIVGTPATGRAEIPPTINIDVQGACPSAETIKRQLGPLLPDTQVRVSGLGQGPTATVIDDDERFSIAVGGAQRSIAEPARDCVERARVSAVFIALALDPPQISPVPQPSTEQPASPLSSDQNRLQQPVRVSFGAACAISTAPRSASKSWSAGPTLGAGIGRNSWELATSVGFSTPVTLRFPEGSVRLQRSPFEFGMRLLTSLDFATGYAGAGIQLDVLQLSGVGVERSTREFRAGLGGRGALGARLKLTPKWSGYAELNAAFFPKQYSLELLPGRVLGQTPQVWLGLTIGAFFLTE